MPFTPKFVDLVRNFTTVQGTGPVSLGQAVSGYTSLADAAAAGDQFYYCLQGVDKPQEREVGRGTMQANGTVARQPISGGPTNFSGGTKTIALVAAAEWFTKFESGGAGGGAAIDVGSTSILAARTVPNSLPALLTQAGREGIFTFESGDRSALVAADANQGLFVAPQSDPTGASGAWARRFDGAVNVRWFGATGDGATNDGPAFAAALAALKKIAANDQTIYKGSPKLFVPAGHYYLGATTLDITHTLIIEGEGSGQAGGVASKLRWAANTTGIRIQRANTSGASTVDSPNHYGGDATTLRGLMLMGAFTTLASEGAYHGVHAKARVLIDQCFIQNWQGNGVNIVATSGGGPLEGNANQFAVMNTTCWYCQNGIYIDGADANAGYTQGCDVSYCRQWGLWDSSFLGNAHIAPHAANNGFADNGLGAPPYLPPTIVSYSGNRYYVLAGQEAGASTNAPSGTAANNNWWGYAGAGGPVGASIPAWSSGTTYRTGGPYRTDDPNASCTFINAYTEGGQAPPQFNAGTTTALGGLWGTGLGGYGGYLAGNAGGFVFGKDLRVGRNLDVAGNMSFGPQFGAGNEATVTVRNTGQYSWLNFDNFDASGNLVENTGSVFAETGLGLVFNGKSNGSAIRFRAAGAGIATIKNTGFELATGKVLLVGGTQVVGGQQAAIANHASDSTVNAILSALRAHGLIAA